MNEIKNNENIIQGLSNEIAVDWKNLISYTLSSSGDFENDLNFLAYLSDMFVLSDENYKLIDFKEYDEKGFSVMTKDLSWEHYPDMKSLPENIWGLLEDPGIFQTNVHNYNCQIFDWIPVIGHPLWEINKKGEVRNILTKKYKKTPAVHKLGYQLMRIDKEVKPLHWWILNSWKKNPDPETLTDVNHINSHRHDNRLENLEFISHKDNCSQEHCRQAHRNATKNIGWMGTREPKAIIGISPSGEEVNFCSVNFAAKTLEIGAPAITHVLKGRANSASGWKFRYKE